MVALTEYKALFSGLAFALTTRKQKSRSQMLVAAMFLCTNSYAMAMNECVVLLHGLARTASSMTPVKTALEQAGYQVANIDYPSRTRKIEELAPDAVGRGLEACKSHEPERIHFVTHSLGGILVRYYLERNEASGLGHVVMLGPPNQGSQVVDSWQNVPGFKLLNGPAGLQLGTDPNSIPSQLGPVAFSLGVIAGTRTLNPILSQSLPNPDDGKVSVENTKVSGMADHHQMPVTHTFMMRSSKVHEQILHFLRNGRFNR